MNDSTYNVDKGSKGEDDKTINNYQYDEGYLITSTPEQDAIMRNEFKKISKTKYKLLSNNCATTVQRVMNMAKLKTGDIIGVTYEPISSSSVTPFVSGGTEVVFDFKYASSILPSNTYKAIIKANPSGSLIYRNGSRGR